MSWGDMGNVWNVETDAGEGGMPPKVWFDRTPGDSGSLNCCGRLFGVTGIG
jgi:hypothetical protein